MSAVQALYDITKQLAEQLQKNVAKSERDSYIEQLQNILEKREDLIENVKPPYTTNEKKLGTEIVEMNKEISMQLTKVKKEVQYDILQLKKKKSSNNKYVNPYQSLSIDGMFYDKRK